MKIAFVSPDGISILLFCKGILKALKSTREETRVYVVIGDDQCITEILGLGVEVKVVPMYRFFKPIRDLRTVWCLYRLFRHEKFDIVLNFSTKPNVYGSIAAWLAGVPLRLFHVVGLGTAFLPQQNLQGKVVKYFFCGLYKVACKVTHKVWFTNKNDLSFFVKAGMIEQSKTALTRNYLDTDHYAPMADNDPELIDLRRELGLSGGEKVVVMVARMIWAKGIKEYAEVAVGLSKHLPEVHFLLIAPLETGSEGEVPEDYIRKMEEHSNLRWFGFRKDVIRFYGIADIAVLPTYYKEGGYPRTLLEPMSMCKPVIATDSEDCRGAIDEGKNGYLVPIKDSGALANAIKCLLFDDEKMASFAKHSRHKAVTEFEERLIIKQALTELGVLSGTPMKEPEKNIQQFFTNSKF